jgi:MutS domain V
MRFLVNFDSIESTTLRPQPVTTDATTTPLGGRDHGAREAHETGRDTHRIELVRLESRVDRIATARLILAGTALAIVGAIVWVRPGDWIWSVLGLVVVAFVVLVVLHARAHGAKERAAAALRFHERALARMNHAWERLATTSERFRDTGHPFAADLDVFGQASLMQLVDATETRGGQDQLAQFLAAEGPGTWPDDVIARQRAARDLAGRLGFREALSTAAGVIADEAPNAAPLLAWAERKADRDATVGSGVAWAAFILPPFAAIAGFLGPVLHVRADIIVALVVAELAAGIAISLRLAPMLQNVSSRESAVTRWRAMMTLVEREDLHAPLLSDLRGRLAASGATPGGGRAASEELARLARIVGFVDARHNEVFRLIIGPLLMWDAHCAMALLRWRARAGLHLRGWLDALARVEALASLGAFAFEHDEFAWPELVARPQFEARGLGHPLIADEHRVGNDVGLSGAGRTLVVTGSNMSGKSTLLRAIGVNAVLAFAGAPVCARALSIGPARVATSMRVEDSLERGVSHFYAELARLKKVLDLAGEPNAAPVLFLLDEILHGTNSRERVLGASAVVNALLTRGAFGAVSTHDLGITALARELGGLVENVHFEEQVNDDKMTFDYLLRPGIVQSSNALRLMRAVGIDIDAG